MKSKVYRRKMDTQDERLVHIMDVIAHIKECPDVLS
jgi:hypothetical protein